MQIPILPFKQTLGLTLLLLLGVGVLTYLVPQSHPALAQEALEVTVDELVDMAEDAAAYEQLRTLTVVLHQKDRKLPTVVQQFTQLKALRILGANQWCSLRALQGMKHLQLLWVQNVPWKYTMKVATQLPLLRELHVINCQVVGLGPDLSKLRWLQVLDLSENSLSLAYDVEELMLLPQLQALRLDFNPIRIFPARLVEHATLQYLSLRYCQLQADATDWTPQGTLGRLGELYLDHNQLEAVPQGVIQLPQLQLNLSNNQLRRLPDSLACWPTLRLLDLSQNVLQALPQAWVQGRSLQYLSLSHNQLKDLPFILGGNVGLTYLDLSHNQLTTVPACIRRMEALSQLSLYGNQIKQLPSFFRKLPQLSELLLDTQVIGSTSLSVIQRRQNQFLNPWQPSILQSYSAFAFSPLHSLPR